MSEDFLRKALEPLAAAGVLTSARGPHGGYRLARPAERITPLEVVEAVEGPLRGQAPAVGTAREGKRLDKWLQAMCDKAAEAARAAAAGEPGGSGGGMSGARNWGRPPSPQ